MSEVNALARPVGHADTPTVSGRLGERAETPADWAEAERERIRAKVARFAPPPARDAEGRLELVGLTREEIVVALAEIGEKAFRAKQIWQNRSGTGSTTRARPTSP